MDEDQNLDASQSQEREVSVEDLHRAAEEARQTEESTSKESVEEQREEQHQEAPEDNSERSRLGRKVAAQEKIIEKMSGQLQQVTNIIQMYAQSVADAQSQQQHQHYEEDEYIPTDKKGFLSFLDQIQTQKTTQAQRDQMAFAHKYVSVVDELGQEEDDPAFFAEVKRLTTEPGQPFNKRYSDDPVADAERNYNKAGKYLLKQRISSAKSPENPLKGGKPSAPLGAASSTTPRSAQKPMELDDFAKRAAKFWEYDEKGLKDMGF